MASLSHDLVIIGAGAAGLMSAISAGRAAREAGATLRIAALDGAKTLGAKILVAGGGRCNVTHERVDERDYAGSTAPAIRKVLGALSVEETISFFRGIGVELKREDTGKLFPTTDRARTVLDGLITECRRLNIELLHPWRVGAVERHEGGLVIHEQAAPPVEANPHYPAVREEAVRSPTSAQPDVFPLRTLRARRVIVCTGGKALPKSGSDGAGYGLVEHLGHSITTRVFAALAPLVVPAPHFVHTLSGVASVARVSVRAGAEVGAGAGAGAGKVLATFTGPVLCTHFGLSGPAILNLSRHLTLARFTDPHASVQVNWLPALNAEQADAALRDLRGVPIVRWLTSPPRGLPERLARALLSAGGLDHSAAAEHLAREKRRALVEALTGMTVPVTADRGFTYAEATAGGVPLSELNLATMESRCTPGLHLAGEICDVDGRLGGFNFQWAWASGHVAGSAAARALIGASAS